MPVVCFLHVHISYFVLFLTALPSTSHYQKARYIRGGSFYIYLYISIYIYIYLYLSIYRHIVTHRKARAYISVCGFDCVCFSYVCLRFVMATKSPLNWPQLPSDQNSTWATWPWGGGTALVGKLSNGVLDKFAGHLVAGWSPLSTFLMKKMEVYSLCLYWAVIYVLCVFFLHLCLFPAHEEIIDTLYSFASAMQAVPWVAGWGLGCGWRDLEGLCELLAKLFTYEITWNHQLILVEMDTQWVCIILFDSFDVSCAATAVMFSGPLRRLEWHNGLGLGRSVKALGGPANVWSKCQKRRTQTCSINHFRHFWNNTVHSLGGDFFWRVSLPTQTNPGGNRYRWNTKSWMKCVTVWLYELSLHQQLERFESTNPQVFCRLAEAFVRENERTWSEATALGVWCWSLIWFAQIHGWWMNDWWISGWRITGNGLIPSP